MDYDKHHAIISEELVESFAALHQRAHQSFNEWFETIQFEYDELMIQLQDLWELCVVDECDRFFPKTFNPEIQTVDDIENLKNEIAQLQLKYTEGKAIYDKLREWLAIWNEKLEYEEEESKSAKEKYNNRGGSLQARLKREAQLKNLVPKVLSELEALCEEFSHTHENIPTAGPGRMHAGEYARWLVRSHEDMKVLDKMHKDDVKRAQLAQESRFGVSPSPSKSLMNRTKATPIRNTPIRKTPRKAMLGFNASKSLKESIIEPICTPTVSRQMMAQRHRHLKM
jgi:DNA repair exonuclease SbcCD ATPase subunit